MQLFSADATIFSKKIFFLPTKSWKKHPQKLLRKTQIHFFPYCPEPPKRSKQKNSCSEMRLIELGLLLCSSRNLVWLRARVE